MKATTYRRAVLLFLTISLLGFAATADAKVSKRNSRFSFDEENDYTRRSAILEGRRYNDALIAPQRAASASPTPQTAFHLSVSSNPNDQYWSSRGSWGQTYDDLWGVKRVRASNVWRQNRGQGASIAVVDTGVNWMHEDLSANLWTNDAERFGLPGIDDDGNGFMDDVNGWDFVDDDNLPSDLHGHGTHVAGIAAAMGFNGKGIIGVAPDAKILPVRVLDRSGSGTIDDVANGIRYAALVGADVINLSLGAYFLDDESYSTLEDAVQYAVDRGSIVVAAAGNSNFWVDFFSPANILGVISVGATKPDNRRASFSNFGYGLSLTAPGVDILSLGMPGASIGSAASSLYYRASGTSMAAPFVSGAVALILNKYPFASLGDIAAFLALGSKDLGALGWDPFYGYGLLDVSSSMAWGDWWFGPLPSSSAFEKSVSDPISFTPNGQAVLDQIAFKQDILSGQMQFRQELKEQGASLVVDRAEAQHDILPNIFQAA